MRIVYLCDEYPPPPAGGIGTFTHGLSRALAAHGHEVHVVGHYARDCPVRDLVDGVHVWRLVAPSGPMAPLTRRYSVWRALRAIGRAGPIDVLEAPDFEGAAALVPRASRCRVVRLHGSHVYFSAERNVPHSRSVAWLEYKNLCGADAIVSVSAYTANRTRDLFGLSKPADVIYNAVDIPASASRKTNYHERRRMVYFGTLVEKKGVLVLADAWREFHATHPGWRLVLLGRDTFLHGESVQSLMMARMGDAVHMAEFVGGVPYDQLLESLSEFDFAVLPSFSESFGLVVTEAMTIGLPVIFSELSSGPELIDDGVDGWLCDPRQMHTLVEAMTRAASSADERARIAMNARRKVETKFSYPAFVDANLDFYRTVLAEKERRT